VIVTPFPVEDCLFSSPPLPKKGRVSGEHVRESWGRAGFVERLLVSLLILSLNPPLQLGSSYLNLFIHKNTSLHYTHYLSRITTDLCRFTRRKFFDTIEGMGKAGKALRQALETFGISQNKLAVALGVKPYVVFRWFHEQTDPSAETAADIAKALHGLDPAAADEFVRLYLGDYLQDSDKT